MNDRTKRELRFYETRKDAYFESFEGVFFCIEEWRVLRLEYDGEITIALPDEAAAVFKRHALEISKKSRGD